MRFELIFISIQFYILSGYTFMFDFLHQNITAQDSLKAKFNVTIETKTFKKVPDPYLLIDLPCEQKELNVNGRKMTIMEHHFSMPQKQDKKTNSIYHYTLVLSDPKNKKLYRTHLYFDKLDRITLEPKLFSEDGEFLLINEAGMKNIRVYAMQFTTLITFIRKMQQEAITEIRNKIEETESQLMLLSRNLEGNKQRYLEMVAEQIEKLESLEIIGCKSYTDEKYFYGRLLQRLTSSSTETTKPSQNSLPESSIAPENTDLSDKNNESQISVKAKSSKRRSRKNRM